MVIHTELECVFKPSYDRDPAFNHAVVVSMIARSGVCARVRAQARGRAPAPLPARVAMALAPPPNFLRGFLKHHYDFETLMALPKFLGTILKTRYAFESC